MYNLSASKLVVYKADYVRDVLMKKKEFVVTENMWKGVEYQSKKEKQLQKITKDKVLPEMRGYIERKGFRIYFSNDLVIDNIFIEVKSVLFKSKNLIDYIKRSVIQAAFYKSMLDEVDTLETATFHFKETGIKNVIKRPENTRYFLFIGDLSYEIMKVDPRVKEFFIRKAKAVVTSDKAARVFAEKMDSKMLELANYIEAREIEIYVRDFKI